jgi:hypothetical protein
VIRTGVALTSDELCYLDSPATYHKVRTASVAEFPGRMLVTNRRVIFSALRGGGEIPLGKVLTVRRHSDGVALELSRAANAGFYAVQDSRLTAEIILAAVRLSNRQVLSKTERDSRRIPQHVKAEVWARDRGQCVQCAASEYLEFDHVIPHSKGGASSVNNLQLLCRKCNALKSDKL